MSLKKIKDPYLKKLYNRLCTGPCGQSAAVLEAREADRKAIIEIDQRLTDLAKIRQRASRESIKTIHAISTIWNNWNKNAEIRQELNNQH